MRKERDYLWHVKPVWDHNSVAAWQGIISRGRQQLEPGAAVGEAGREGETEGSIREGPWQAFSPRAANSKAPLWNVLPLGGHVWSLKE